MSFKSDFESAIEYIEDNLTIDIDFNMVARQAKCSTYHFQRLFSSLVGIPLSEYIRRRRMTLAAIEIQNTDTKIIDIAMKYGYDSHSSFTRAFQTVQNVTPSKARSEGVTLIAYTPLTFQFILKGVEAMKYQIIEKEAYKVFGFDVIETDGFTNEQYVEYADRILENGTHDKINKAAGFPGVVLDMIESNSWDSSKIHLLKAIHFWDEDGHKKFMFGWELPETGVNEDFTVLDIPPMQWVVVTHQLDGDRSVVSRCFNDLYINWFPTSGYEQAPGCPVIEVYDSKNVELWMPIVKK